MSKKINCYLLLDFETGGLDYKKNPICEFGCLGINGVNLEEVLRYDNIVKPYDDSLVYEEQAVKIHGLSKEICERDGIGLKQLVEDICLVIEETNVYKSKIAKPIVVGHNVTFDIPFLQDAFLRAGIDISQYLSGYWYKDEYVLHYEDTMHLAKQADAHKDDKLKYSNEECCKRNNIELSDAHRALNDVISTTDLFRYYISKLRSNGAGTVSDGSGKVRKTFKI